MGTKQLYIIKSCEQILNMYCNSINHFQRWGWGGALGHNPKNIHMLLDLPNFDQTM